jgi:hypothetical protein
VGEEAVEVQLGEKYYLILCSKLFPNLMVVIRTIANKPPSLIGLNIAQGYIKLC